MITERTDELLAQLHERVVELRTELRRALDRAQLAEGEAEQQRHRADRAEQARDTWHERYVAMLARAAHAETQLREEAIQ